MREVQTSRKARRRGRRGAAPAASGRRCRVESVVSFDERGQMVLPKEVRERAGLRPGDRLAVITWEEGGKIRVVCLTKADELSGSALNLIAPLMRTP